MTSPNKLEFDSDAQRQRNRNSALLLNQSINRTPLPPSSALDAVRAFLPQIQKANEELRASMANGTSAVIDADIAVEEEDDMDQDDESEQSNKQAVNPSIQFFNSDDDSDDESDEDEDVEPEPERQIEIRMAIGVLEDDEDEKQQDKKPLIEEADNDHSINQSADKQETTACDE